MQWRLELPDELATRWLGTMLAQTLSPGSILLLNGDLGSGKTTLVQSLGQGLGITEPIVSPTFALVSEYPEARIPLYHFDLYRLQPEEVSELYLEIYWDGEEYPLGIVAIEWAERCPNLPSEYLQLCFSAQNSGRQVAFVAVGAAHQQSLQQLMAAYAQTSLEAHLASHPASHPTSSASVALTRSPAPVPPHLLC